MTEISSKKTPLFIAAGVLFLLAVYASSVQNTGEHQPKTGALVNGEPTLQEITSLRLAMEDLVLAGKFKTSGFNVNEMVNVLAELEEQETLFSTSGSSQEDHLPVDERANPELYGNYLKLTHWFDWVGKNSNI